MSSIAILKDKTKQNNHSVKKLITFINPFSYLFLRKNLDLFGKFDSIAIDGIVLVYLLRLIGIKTIRKSFDMTSLAPEVFQKCIAENKSIYFIGSTPTAIDDFIKTILNGFPSLNIVGYRNGYFDGPEDRQGVLNNIASINPDIVVVGMGTPYQEQFLVDLQKTGWEGIGYTCGGFIHQTAKGIDYYPKFYNKYNLRWLYRIIDEPKLISRYTIQYPKAVILFLWDALKYKLGK